MNWLFWKDFRNNRAVVIMAVVFLLVPHLMALCACRGQSQQICLDNFYQSSLFGLILAQLAIVAVAGNAIAGERVDRSSEFLASLPITRKKILASKLLFSLAVAAVIWLTDASVLVWLANQPVFMTQQGPHPHELMRILGHIAIIVSVMFSVAWFLSSFLTSPTFAVVGGLLTPPLLCSGFLFVGYLLQYLEEDWFWDLAKFGFFAIYLGLAPVCFAAGTWIYLRRVEP